MRLVSFILSLFILSSSAFSYDFNIHQKLFNMITGYETTMPIKVVMSRPFQNWSALCYKKREVYITEELMRIVQKSYPTVNWIVLHELGHCELGRKHESAMIEYNQIFIPVSIMHPSLLLPDDIYMTLHEYYWCEYNRGLFCLKYLPGYVRVGRIP